MTTSATSEFPFHHSTLWQEAFLPRLEDPFERERDRLRVALDNLRTRAGILANEISADLRELTVHDLSHSDALWDTADVILGSESSLNPLETFAVGAAFLIHDLGMGLAAYPEGLETLKRHQLWPGMLRNFFKRFVGHGPDDAEFAKPPNDVLLRTQFEILRVLHAERAEHLLEVNWRGHTGELFHLLEDSDLRLSLGRLIGRIAYSHWWPIENLAKEFPLSQGSPVFLPPDWTIDPLRVALILRTADASHIDARRAPPFLRVIRRPKGDSEWHWSFQEKLNRVRLQDDRLVYTGRPFPEGDANAWWLCVDTLRMIDKELRDSDNMLVDRRCQRFLARGVLAADSPEVIATLIPPDGWSPVDARVHVSSVSDLVSRLGGKELYGDNNSVALRELLQNAADAIDARRIVQRRTDWGRIILRTGADEHGPWIEVEDNGIGMSESTFIGAFLDFGRSFWSSSDAVLEFPALAAADFRSIGRFGVGFFSVFMLGTRVSVTTRRFDLSARDTRVLTFYNGVGNRPIMRSAAEDEFISDGGTRVRVWVDGVSDTSGPWIDFPSDLNYFAPSDPIDPFSFVSWLCLLLGIEVRAEREGQEVLLSSALTLESVDDEKLVKWSDHPRFPRPSGFTNHHIRPLRHKGKIVGRAALEPQVTLGWFLVGGMRTKAVSDCVGVFDAEPRSASRDECWSNLPKQEVVRWANEQAKLIVQDFDPGDQFELCRNVAELGGSTKAMRVGRIADAFVLESEIEEWAAGLDEVLIVSSFHADHIAANLGFSRLLPNVIFESLGGSLAQFFSRQKRIRSAAPSPRLAKYEAAGFDIIRDSERVARPVLSAIGKTWRKSLSNIFFFRELGHNICSDGSYLIDEVEIAHRRPPRYL